MATTSPTITLPTANASFTAVAQPDPIGSVQPLPTRHDGSIDGTIRSGLTAKILLGASTPLVAITTIIPPIIPPRDCWCFRWGFRWGFCWAGRWPGCARSVLITHILAFTAVANVVQVPVIDSQSPATLVSVTVVRIVG